MEDSFKKLIDENNSILILLPVKPYFDQVAAGLSLYLSFLGKKDVVISCPNQMLVEFNRLVGVNKVSSEMGNKNLLISLSDYPASNIEKVSYDIENQEFKLAIVPKTGMVPPKKEQVKVSFAGVSADLVILVGGSTLQQFPALSTQELAGKKIAHIGVKALTGINDESIMSFAQTSSSVSEIVAMLVKQLSIQIDQDIATNLLLGIEDSSRNFTSDYVTADTFQVVSDLMRLGAKRGRVQAKHIPEGAQPDEIFNRPNVSDNVINEKREENNPPQEWLTPKIYKGTTTS